jgi:hypothetical protein
MLTVRNIIFRFWKQTYYYQPRVYAMWRTKTYERGGLVFRQSVGRNFPAIAKGDFVIKMVLKRSGDLWKTRKLVVL